MADEYKRYESRPGGCLEYEKDAAVSEFLDMDWRGVIIYFTFTKRLQGHSIVHPGERFCRIAVDNYLCPHTVC
jgi:hypothetical protein